MAKLSVVASDLYPAVRSFLLANELSRSVKAFDKETTVEGEEAVNVPKERRKLAKRLAALELTAACHESIVAAEPAFSLTVEPVDVFPVLQRFFVESGLQRSLKAFEKDTATEEAPAAPKERKKVAKRLAGVELAAVCQASLDAQSQTNGTTTVEATPAAEASAKKDKDKKRKAAEEAEAAEPKVNGKKQNAAEEVEAPEASSTGEEKSELEAPKKKQKKEKEPKVHTPFSRIDYDKCVGLITDSRLMDNTHTAKAKFGEIGDTWADQASEDLLKVKGKGFRKEMAKKKRASWRGGGELDMGVNSVPFPDSDSE